MFVQAGAGIVADSVPPNEHQECINKAKALFRAAEEALLNPAGLPGRPWYRHTIYAPGVYTGYAAVVIPGVNEAIEAGNTSLAQAQLTALAQALNRSAAILEAAAK